VRDWHGELDVAHALATHAGERYFDAAAVADDTLVLDALVLSARALPIPRGTEDALTEESALLGLERAVVDRLGVFDFAAGPRTDGIRRSHGDADLVKAHGPLLTHQFTNSKIAHSK
jgi:hypothetical protein